MTDYSQLALALEHRLAVVADHKLRDQDPQAHLTKLRSASESLAALVSSLPSDCDPHLRHYLERQSYQKAVDWLRSPGK